MNYICIHTDCPRCRTTLTTRIDVETRMPVVLHICTCEYRKKNDGVCCRCGWLRA